MIDLDKMTLEEVLKYCEEREKWILNIFVSNEGIGDAIIILAENGRLQPCRNVSKCGIIAM